MRLLKLLTTKELEHQIKTEYLKIYGIIKKELDINFYPNLPNADDGEYVYANDVGYHYVLCERGKEIEHKITDDVFEISFWAIYPSLIRPSFDYELQNRDETLDYGEVAFAKQLEYLELLGENFKKRGEIEISQILENNP